MDVPTAVREHSRNADDEHGFGFVERRYRSEIRIHRAGSVHSYPPRSLLVHEQQSDPPVVADIAERPPHAVPVEDRHAQFARTHNLNEARVTAFVGDVGPAVSVDGRHPDCRLVGDDCDVAVVEFTVKRHRRQSIGQTTGVGLVLECPSAFAVQRAGSVVIERHLRTVRRYRPHPDVTVDRPTPFGVRQQASNARPKSGEQIAIARVQLGGFESRRTSRRSADGSNRPGSNARITDTSQVAHSSRR